MPAPLTLEQMKALAVQLHGEKYDYSLWPDGVKRAEQVRIICPEHGEYTCKLGTHLAGNGKCPSCAAIEREQRTQAMFKHKSYYIEKAIAVHGDSYDYSQVPDYPSYTKARVTLVCKHHGPFQQLLSHHITNKAECPTCADITRAKKTQKGAEFYLSKVRDGSKYDYTLVPPDAKAADEVPIICPEHGVFNQILVEHSKGHGCPKCGRERSEAARMAIWRQKIKHYDLLNDAEWLKARHHDDQLNLQQISEIIGCGECVVGTRLKEFGIQLKRFPKSVGEQEVANLLIGLVGSNNLLLNDRTLLHPQELDIVIPSHKLAIEYCGLYWHSDKWKDKDYHLRKLDACNKAGVRLITLFEDEWKQQPEIVVSKIKAAIQKDDRNQVYARTCSVVKMTREQKRSFFDQHHIQGSGPGSVTYGLTNNNMIVAAMAFIKQRDGRWDLNRFATSCRVPGGFSKLLTHFKRHHSWTEIVSFADRRWSEGGLYEKNGFVLDKILPPDYYYTNGSTRKHKFNFRHKNLPKILGEQYNPNETEFQNMDRSNYVRIWNCGLLRYVMRQES